jgi:hypothetical protein
MTEHIDWRALALQLGTLTKGGEFGGSNQAREALEVLLGEDNLRAAVDYYISGRPGSELTRSVLWYLRPWSAMKYCYDIYVSGRCIDSRRAAVELLRVVADERAVGWVAEFLEDEDADIQSWGGGLLDQLIFSGQVDADDVEELISRAEAHANPIVRDRAEVIRADMDRRRA